MDIGAAKLLAIDGDQDKLTLLLALIAQTFPEASVLSAPDGKSGYDAALSVRPDVIILGSSMPGMNSCEVCRKLKSAQALDGIPVVFITAGSGEKASRSKALASGAEAFLTWPIDESELVAQIRAMVIIRNAYIDKQGILSQQKRVEEQLKQHVKDLLESQRIAHLGTWRLDLATGQVTWSEELYKMYGYDPALPPPPYTEHMKLFTGESWEKLSTALEKTRVSGIPYELELETVTRDGSNGWMWVRGEAEKDAMGSIISLWGAAQDITLHKKKELEIKQSEERFQLLFNKAPIGYQSLDSDGRFIDVNQQWLDTLGYAKEEIIGRWFGDFLCPQYVEAFRERFPVFKAQGYIGPAE